MTHCLISLLVIYDIALFVILHWLNRDEVNFKNVMHVAGKHPGHPWMFLWKPWDTARMVWMRRRLKGVLSGWFDWVHIADGSILWPSGWSCGGHHILQVPITLSSWHYHNIKTSPTSNTVTPNIGISVVSPVKMFCYQPRCLRITTKFSRPLGLRETSSMMWSSLVYGATEGSRITLEKLYKFIFVCKYH